ncbi:hypothetical protein N9A26_00015 [bacterium]|nr:hypothetical protein [bacterium]
MNTIKLLLSTTLVTFLVGCELMPTRKTQATKNMEYEIKIMEDAYAKDDKCFQELEEKHAEAKTYVVDNILVAKEKADRKIYTKNKYELLMSTRFFEERDKAFFIEYLNAVQTCLGKSIDNYAKADNRYTLLIREHEVASNQLFIDFMMQKINVAQLNKKNEEILTKIENDWGRVNQQRNKEAERAHYNEVDRNLEAYKADQQVAAARAKNAPPTTNWGDVYFDAIKQNKTTNCQVYGNTVNCQSY